MDPVQELLRKQLPLLNAEEERRLITLAHLDPDASAYEHSEAACLPISRDAKDRLVRSNIRLVVRAAKRIWCRNPSMRLNDLVAAGLTGFLHAVDKFELHRNMRLCTYAMNWVRLSIGRWICEHGFSGRPTIPLHALTGYKRATKSREALAARTDEELVEVLRRSRGKVGKCTPDLLLSVHRTRTAALHPIGRVRLNQVEDNAEFVVVADPSDEADPVAMAERNERLDGLSRLLDALPERHRAIVVAYYGLGGGPEGTYESVGEAFGVTRERIRQILGKAAEAMRSRAKKDAFIKCSLRLEEPESSSPSACRMAV